MKPSMQAVSLPKRALLLLLVVIVVWAGLCTWWYSCRIKQVCTPQSSFAELAAQSLQVQPQASADHEQAAIAPPADEQTAREEPASNAVDGSTVPAAMETPKLALASALAAPPSAAAAPAPFTAYFGRKSTEIRVSAEGQKALASLLAAAQAGRKILIVGHSDARGSPALKAQLSEQRAAILRDWLLAHGLPATSIAALESREDREPVADNATSEGRARNRRAVAMVLP